MSVWIRSLVLGSFAAITVGAAVGTLLGWVVPEVYPGAGPAILGVIIAGAIAVGFERPRAALWTVPPRPLMLGFRGGTSVVFGVALGSMFVTQLASYSVLFLLAWGLLLASPAQAMVVFGIFGAARMIPVIAEAGRSAHCKISPDVWSPWAELAANLRISEVGVLILCCARVLV